MIGRSTSGCAAAVQSTQTLTARAVVRPRRRTAAGRAGSAPSAPCERSSSASFCESKSSPSVAPITAAISRMSSSTRPRVVSAGVPMRRPEGSIGGRSSKGIALRFTVMPTSSSRSSASLPKTPVGVRSVRTRWTSVPPVSTSTPASTRPSARARALAIVWRWRSRELLARGDLQRDGLGGDDVHQRAALLAGEDRAVDVLGELLAAEDDPAARAAEGLVDRRRDDVGVLDGVRVLAGGDQPGEVRHVHHQPGADRVGDLAERGEVELARVGGPAGDDHLRLVLRRRATRPRPCRRAGRPCPRGTATTS